MFLKAKAVRYTPTGNNGEYIPTFVYKDKNGVERTAEGGNYMQKTPFSIGSFHKILVNPKTNLAYTSKETLPLPLIFGGILLFFVLLFKYTIQMMHLVAVLIPMSFFANAVYALFKSMQLRFLKSQSTVAQAKIIGYKTTRRRVNNRRRTVHLPIMAYSYKGQQYELISMRSERPNKEGTYRNVYINENKAIVFEETYTKIPFGQILSDLFMTVVSGAAMICFVALLTIGVTGHEIDYAPIVEWLEENTSLIGDAPTNPNVTTTP